MSTKSKTIAAAERKQITAEIRQLRSNRKKIGSDFHAAHRASRAEVLRLYKVANAALKAADAANAKHLKAAVTRDKTEARALSKIDRRIALLEGRL